MIMSVNFLWFKKYFFLIIGFVLSVSTNTWAQTGEKSKKSSSNQVEIIEAPSSSGTGILSSSIPLRNYSFTLKQLGVLNPFQLRGTDPIYSVPFSVPADEVVTALKLKLDFTYSPSLLTNLSHLKIILNGEVAHTFPLPKETAGQPLVREISIDPRLASDFNRLSLQFIGHYTLDCEDPFHSSLWLNVSNLSSIQLTVTPFSVVNDLSLLPVPFFDRRDGRRLERPFVFGANPSSSTLESAGIVASWFGDLASYRGAWFPAHLNKLPNDNVVVLATNDDKPQGILDIPPINGPTISVASHPADVKYKVLYVLGRDAAELKIAATALGLGRYALAGQAVTQAQLEGLQPRKAYDAPRWLRSDRPVKFGEIATLDDLNVRGLSPDLVRLNVTTPPDLFGWRTKGVPIDLKYRYTPRPRPDKSNLNVLMNQRFITSFPLLSFPGASSSESSIASLIAKLNPTELLPAHESFYIPVSQFRSKNQLQFHFSFDYPKEGACRDVMLDNVRGAIDPESEIDITGFPHYIKMPDLSAFANTGFPFTKYADLSQTAVVMPDNYTTGDIGTYLTLMGRMGNSTGLVVYGVSVRRAADVQQVADKDLLILGGPANQPLLRDWGKYMPFSVDGSKRVFLLTDLKEIFMPWFEKKQGEALSIANISANTLAKDAVLFGFESPLNKGRSVVAFTSDKTGGQADILNALMDADVVPKIQGAVSIIRGKEVDSMETDQTYMVGSLPPILAIYWTLANQPWGTAGMLVIAAIVIAGVFYTLLRMRAARRLTGK